MAVPKVFRLNDPTTDLEGRFQCLPRLERSHPPTKGIGSRRFPQSVEDAVCAGAQRCKPRSAGGVTSSTQM